MLSLGWVRVRDKGDPHDNLNWDYNWSDVAWVHDMPSPLALGSHARVCHFPTHYELTRKDYLTNNIKRHVQTLKRAASAKTKASKPGAKGGAGPAVPMRETVSSNPNRHSDFLPTTYQLPGEYHMFVEEFKRSPKSAWIMKPVGRAQGKGIFLFQKLADIDKWKQDTRWDHKEESENRDAYIVSLYIPNPYLIGKRKFDMRFYVLVTSYNPLTVWVYREGFARFSGALFSMDKDTIENKFIHLTNVAIQKTAEDYDKSKGCKWLFTQVKAFLVTKHGRAVVDACLEDIDNCFIESLLAVQPRMSNDGRCFECYGYDILLDENLKPWLIEVNASPSITADTETDYHLKFGMLEDLFGVLRVEKTTQGQEEISVGGFDLVHKGGPVHRKTAYSTAESKPRLNSFLGSYNGDRKAKLDDTLARCGC